MENEKGLKKIVLKIDGGYGIIPICHVTFLNFGQNKLKTTFRWVGGTR
jgi:hypothetical protein